jgi:O-methyltransferase involved in polyketide biosynthesis
MAERGDLTVTALYTSHVWTWARFEAAHLLATKEARDVFRVTNFVLGLARLFRPELPLLKEGLAQRHAIIDRLARESRCTSIVELAAGLSPRGAAFSADSGIDYVEVDLPSVVEKKRALLERTADGRAVLARSNFRLHGADVTAIDLSALSAAHPACVIAEGFFMYLTADQQRALWRSLAKFLGSGTLVFDLVPAVEQPKPGRIGRLLDDLFRRFTKGATFAFDERTRDDVVRELHEAGFEEVTLVEPATAPERWDLPHLDRPTQQLVFVCRMVGKSPAGRVHPTDRP